MATSTNKAGVPAPGGGTTVSFGNTPQAGDDSYSYTEDQLLANSSIYNDASHILTLDVMSNDLGGAAKKLYSIDDGNGNPLASDAQLLVKDVGTNGISAWETTDDGNQIRINNGKIEFDLSHSLSLAGATSVNALAAGDVIDDDFVYTIQLGNGTLSQAHVHVHIVGENDVASISGDQTGDVTEDGTPTASGAMFKYHFWPKLRFRRVFPAVAGRFPVGLA